MPLQQIQYPLRFMVLYHGVTPLLAKLELIWEAVLGRLFVCMLKFLSEEVQLQIVRWQKQICFIIRQ